jgi:IclR family transcriptional regulator, pca regulon regulatory protein
MGTSSNDPSYMESLARGLSVIRAFGGDRQHLSGADVAAITGLSRAAARRCLHTLTVLGYASSSNGLYELTPAVLTLGQAYLGSASLAGVAQPVLERVTAQLEEAAAVAVLDGDDIVFVARAAARRILAVEVSIGSRLPAASTASGRVMLAFAPETRRSRFLSRAKLTRHTPHTIVDRKQLRHELERVRADGYALIDQELEVGLRSMAVPIQRADGMVVAAINIGVQAGRVDVKTMQRDLRPVLVNAAKDIGAMLINRR